MKAGAGPPPSPTQSLQPLDPSSCISTQARAGWSLWGVQRRQRGPWPSAHVWPLPGVSNPLLWP